MGEAELYTKTEGTAERREAKGSSSNHPRIEPKDQIRQVRANQTRKRARQANDRKNSAQRKTTRRILEADEVERERVGQENPRRSQKQKLRYDHVREGTGQTHRSRTHQNLEKTARVMVEKRESKSEPTLSGLR
jgi:hypothetical protein